MKPMRPTKVGLLLLALVIGIGTSQGWFARTYHHLTYAALGDDARMAIDVRCRIDEPGAARECRTTLKKLYLAGALDPDKTLVAYCESVRMGLWGGERPVPPEMCVSRYGGWTAG